MHHLLWLCLVALLAVTADAQTATVVDGNGNTVVQVVTTDPQGLPTTSVVSTLPPAGGAPATTPATSTPTPPTQATQPATTAATTTTTPVQPANTQPPGQQGPVGQPEATSFKAGGVTPYTYTTIIDGVTSVLVDNFTPTNPATQRPTVGASGTILDYSSWLAQYGPPSTSSAANTGYVPPSPAAGWWGVLTSGTIAFLGGLGLALL
ncbi:hypothetical protein LshimejAT787_0101610 [Lyophyllum shimeji]|uniref:Uncharacterized protein n=1 Tax=Lyophyllum shimeji TaxID=47721 RepID=A0A9P3PCJ8_LYOSH|nr:hypothetical protein LshimejAT787_0101610 [Lyophyllum shimeji]